MYCLCFLSLVTQGIDVANWSLRECSMHSRTWADKLVVCVLVTTAFTRDPVYRDGQGKEEKAGTRTGNFQFLKTFSPCFQFQYTNALHVYQSSLAHPCSL